MQVNSISANVNSSKASFGNRIDREAIEQFAQMDDKTLRMAALQKAAVDTKDKKHRRIAKAIYWSIPLAAGLAAVVKNPAKTATSLLKINTSRSDNLLKFAANALNWAGTFAVIGAVFSASNKLEKINKKVREFSKEHPTLTFISKVGASLGALALASFGLSKLAAKSADKPVKFATKKLAYKVNTALNNSKVLNKVSEGLAKIPSSIKGFAKGVAEWSPMLLVLTSLSHSLNHTKSFTVQTAKNYTQLKESQAQIREALAQNDAAVDEEADV
ncbi:MAG: hypothetical protein K2F57_01460 [Candidatus Gastranaerophilales bacterium]|nr:hypothetical protein [Candidatus Gastranaerophilales bacterium]